MAKGKFSKARNRENDRLTDLFPDHSQEDETVLLPHIPQQTDGPEEPAEDAADRFSASMPELSWLSPEDFSQDPEQDLSGIPELLREVSQDSPPSEEEAIERAFRQEIGKEEKKPSCLRKLSRLWSSHRKVVLLSGGAVLLALLVCIAVGILVGQLSDPYGGRILNNVTLGGIDIGGLTQKEAREAVSQAVVPILTGGNMVVELPQQELVLSPSETGITLDIKGAVKDAYRFGRTGSRDQKEADYRSSLTQVHNVDLLPYLQMDRGYVRKQLQSYSGSFSSVLTPSSYALEGEQPPLKIAEYNEDNTPQTLLLNLGTPGSDLDVDRVIQQILGAYARLSLSLTIDMEQACTLPEPLDLDRIHRELTIEPVDSTMDPTSFEVISGSYGYTFDLEEARLRLSQAEYGDTLRIPMVYKAPEIMDEDVFFQDVLAEAQTPHGDNANRNENLRLACEALNGLILHPGDEFSYNATLGERTTAKGYKPAPAYSGNVLVNSPGGGICQVSSTLYYACLLADLQITDRINHGFLPTYIAPGMDATVSWGGPDYKFKNNTRYPIQLQAEATEDTVIVRILGTDERNYYVKMEYTDSVHSPEDIYQEMGPDSGYQNGDVISGGRDGHFVTTYRCKYSKATDELISREKETTSNYPGADNIIASVPTPETEPAPQPEPPVSPEGGGQSGTSQPEEGTPQEGSGTENKPAVPPEAVTPPDNGIPPADPPEAPGDTGEAA